MFAAWFLIFLVIVFLAIFAQFSVLPINAILLGCIFGYFLVFVGRLIGALKHVNLLYIPTLVGIGTALAVPILPYLETWLEPRGQVTINFVLDEIPFTNMKRPVEEIPLNEREAGYSRRAPAQATAPKELTQEGAARELANQDDGDIALIKSMNDQIRQAAELKNGMKLPTKEELENQKRQMQELLNQ